MRYIEVILMWDARSVGVGPGTKVSNTQSEIGEDDLRYARMTATSTASQDQKSAYM